MGTDIRESFLSFIQNPSLETYEAVRRGVIESPAYAPYSGDLTKLEQLLEQKRHKEVIEAFCRSLPNLLLSPRAHLLTGIAFRELGQEPESKAEFGIMEFCLQGIRLTGDGTRERPFKVISTHDEYAVMLALEKKFTRQALSETQGKPCDVFTLEDGTELFFDIADCMAKLRERMEHRQR
jgi:hypothetical protein